MKERGELIESEVKDEGSKESSTAHECQRITQRTEEVNVCT